MERDRIADEIHDLLRQPMGPVAHAVVSDWLQLFRTLALLAVRTNATAQQREDAIRAARAELLKRLREVLPELTRLECLYDRDISAAQSGAEQTYRESFDEEVSRRLEDPDVARATAEQLVRAELRAFRQQLGRDLDERIAQHRQRLGEAVRCILTRL